MPAPSAPAAPASAPSSPPSSSSPPPSAAPKSSPSPPPPAGGSDTSDVFADAFADLDAMDEGKPTPPPKKPAAKTTPPKKAEADAEGAEDQSPEDQEKEKEAAADTGPKDEKKEADEAKPERPVKAKFLREAYEGLKKRVEEKLEPELNQLRAKVQEYEQHSPENAKALQEEMAHVKKRNTELEQHIRFVDYQKSKEYQEQYWQPYVKAWNNAVQELKGLTLTVDNPQTGEPSTREVTEADIQYLASLDPAPRRNEIKRLFPDDAEEVKRHINEISQLYDKTQDALKKAHEEGETRAKTRQEQSRLAQTTRKKFWSDSNQALAQKYPHWFAPAENDNEGNALLSRGQALADLIFSPRDITPERLELLPKMFAEQIRANKPFTQQQLVRLHSIVRNKAANHDRLARQLHEAQSKIAELEKSVKEYETSTPDGIPAGARKRTPPGNFMLDANAELEAMDK